MRPVYIHGMSVVDGSRDMPNLLSKSQLRRCPEYVKLAANTAAEAVQMAQLPEDTDLGRVGTVFASSFGPQVSQITFSDSVVKAGPAKCSPVVFTYKVPNSCAGQICIINGFQGASTMLLGNNPLEYGSLLLQLGKADYMLCGAVDEISDDYIGALHARGQCYYVNFQAGAAMVVLSPKKGPGAEIAIRNVGSCFLEGNPYMQPAMDSDADRISELLQRLCDESAIKPSCIYNSSNGWSFDRVEASAIAQVFGADIHQFSPMLQYGDCLGASFLAAVVHAAQTMLGQETDMSMNAVIVTGIDLKGNYVAALLEKKS